MLKLDPRKQLFVLLWLVAIHSIGVAFGLIFLPPEYLHYFGFAEYSGRFFMMQSGVFHIVMSVAYLMAAYQFWCSTGLVYFAIITKSIATTFLLLFFFFGESSWMILMSALGDGAMAVLLYFSFQYYLKAELKGLKENNKDGSA